MGQATGGVALEVRGSRAMEMVRPPRRVMRLAAALAVCLVTGPIAVLAAPWVQNLRGTGRVVAYAPVERQQGVEAPVDGRVVRWWVAEGSVVKAGDPLVELSDIDAGFVGRLERERAAAEAKVAAYAEKVRSYEQQVTNLEATREMSVAAAGFYVETARQKVLGARAVVEAAAAGLRAAEAQFERHRRLLGGGIVSQRDYELAERDLEVARRGHEAARASLTAAENEVSAAEANLNKTRADAESKVDAGRAYLNEARGQAEEARGSLAKLEVGLSRQESRVVKAPRAGTVLRLAAVGLGEVVKQGDGLLVLVPDAAERAVELWVKGNDAPLISAGAAVRLQFEGWPAVQFAGWPSVAVGTFGGRVALVDSADDGKGNFRVLVTADPGEPAWPEGRWLRQGVRAKGWVLLNRVSVGYEVWRQLNGFPPVIDSPPGGKEEEVKGDVARKRVK